MFIPHYLVFCIFASFHSTPSLQSNLCQTPNPGGGNMHVTAGDAAPQGPQRAARTPATTCSSKGTLPLSSLSSSTSSLASSMPSSCYTCSHGQFPVIHTTCPFHAQQTKGFVSFFLFSCLFSV